MRTILVALMGIAIATSAEARCRLAAPDIVHAGPGCAEAWMDVNLRLNDLQTVGTHNSYKQAIPPRLLAIMRKASPRLAAGLDYAHPPLTAQLDDGARGLELDVVYDPKGSQFANPIGPKVSGEPAPEGYLDAMRAPGFKVMHVQDVDFRSSCWTFKACLMEIKTWSRSHPRHAPILITVNAKDDASPAPGGTAALKFDGAAWDALDIEIRSVFAPFDLIVPDDVQGHYPTLREAVLAGNWPTLGASRGKVMFALDEDARKIAVYRGGRTSLEGRVLFANAGDAGGEVQPYAAYMTLNEAKTDTAHIIAMVKRGFLVRTRADADTVEARSGEVTRRERAFASGAQMVSTDYRHPEARFGSYQVRLADGAIALCNPVRTGDRCAGRPVE